MKYSTFITAFMSLVIITLANAQQHKDAKLDVMVLVDESGGVGDSQYEHLISVVNKLPEIFPLGPTKARIALAAFSTTARVMPGYFTDTEASFRTSIDKLRRRTTNNNNTATRVGLETVQLGLLPRVRKDVPKVLILLVYECTNTEMGMTEETAHRMRIADVRIFLVHIGTAVCSPGTPDIEQHQLQIVGPDNPNRRIHVSNFDKLSRVVFDQVKKQVIDEQVCVYKKVCYYPSDARNTCNASWEVDRNVSVNNCIVQKPDTEVNCNVSDCKSYCKTDWSTGECDNLCDGMPAWCTKACERCNLPDTDTTSTLSVTHGTQPGVKLVSDPRKAIYDEKPSWWTLMWVGVGVGGLLLVILIISVPLAIGRQRRHRRRMETQAALLHAFEIQANESRKLKSRSQARDRSADKGKSPATDYYAILLPPHAGTPNQVHRRPGHHRSFSAHEIHKAGVTTPGMGTGHHGGARTGHTPKATPAKSGFKTGTTAKMANEMTIASWRPRSAPSGGQIPKPAPKADLLKADMARKMAAAATLPSWKPRATPSGGKIPKAAPAPRGFKASVNVKMDDGMTLPSWKPRHFKTKDG